jgi:hypothetical protein
VDHCPRGERPISDHVEAGAKRLEIEPGATGVLRDEVRDRALRVELRPRLASTSSTTTESGLIRGLGRS